jgi:hypothetical protein
MTSNELLGLLLEIEAEDPIDYADLPFDEDGLRRMACFNVMDLLGSDAFCGLAEREREQVVAATITRLVLENMVLNARLLRVS